MKRQISYYFLLRVPDLPHLILATTMVRLDSRMFFLDEERAKSMITFVCKSTRDRIVQRPEPSTHVVAKSVAQT